MGYDPEGTILTCPRPGKADWTAPVSSAGLVQAGAQLGVMRFPSPYPEKDPRQPYGTTRICAHNFAGTNLSSLSKATQDGGWDPACTAAGSPTALPGQPFCLPRNDPSWPPFLSSATLSQPLCQSAQVSTNLQPTGTGLAPQGTCTSVHWPILLPSYHKCVLRNIYNDWESTQGSFAGLGKDVYGNVVVPVCLVGRKKMRG